MDYSGLPRLLSSRLVPIFAFEERDIGKGDLIYSRTTKENIKNRMSDKNLVAVDWNSVPLKFNTQ